MKYLAIAIVSVAVIAFDAFLIWITHDPEYAWILVFLIMFFFV
jgi:hypothetical protein